MWTRRGSPHSPSSVSSPGREMLDRGPPAVFRRRTARGQGRCAATGSPAASRSESTALARHDLSRAAATFWNQATSGPRQVDAGRQHQRQMGKHRHVGGLDRRAARRQRRRRRPGRCRRSISAPKPTSRPSDQRQREQRLAGEGRADDQELAHEDAERRQAGDGHDAEHEAPAEQRMALGQAADVGDPLRALDLRDVADARRRSPTWSGCAWSCAAGRRSWRAGRPCRRRR